MQDTLQTAPRPARFNTIRMLFLIAGVYNFGLALVLFLVRSLETNFSLEHFAAALLLVFGILLCNIAANPVRYKKLIPYAILRSLASCALAGWYLAKGQLPFLWLLSGCAEAAFALVFTGSWLRLLAEDDDI